ncbi:MAG: ABC transporter permease [Thermomicrobiales bacterium]
MVTASQQTVSLAPAAEDAAVAAPPEATTRGWFGRRLRALGAGPLAGLVIIAIFAIFAIFAPVIAPHDPDYQFADGLSALGAPLPPGSPPFLLGTDTFGRDMLSRLIYGSRVALFIAVVPNTIALLLATVVGASAGFFGGTVDTVLMRVTEMMMILPTFLLALALLAVLGPGLHVVVAALVLVSWTYPARVVYGETLRIRELAFVEAARALGAGDPRIIIRHVLPQLRRLLLIYFTLNAASMVLIEAGLGFIGFGVQPPTPSWGAMIEEGSRVLFWPWLILLPGVSLALLGAGFYLVGTGLQRAAGPRLSRVRL